jgi:hypothetical protein
VYVASVSDDSQPAEAELLSEIMDILICIENAMNTTEIMDILIYVLFDLTGCKLLRLRPASLLTCETPMLHARAAQTCVDTGAMQTVKCYAWEDSLRERIDGSRTEELKWIKKNSIIRVSEATTLMIYDGASRFLMLIHHAASTRIDQLQPEALPFRLPDVSEHQPADPDPPRGF